MINAFPLTTSLFCILLGVTQGTSDSWWSFGAIGWLVVMVILVLCEIATMGLTTIWFAAGALVAAIIALCGGPVWLQIGVGLVVSVVLLFYTRPIAMRYFNKKRTKTNVESMIGKVAIVISEVSNLQGTGQVNVSGQEWSARAANDEVVYPVGSVVQVVAVSGVKLIVAEKGEE